MATKDPKWLPNIGFIGAGAMGGPLISRLLGAKYVVSVYDKMPARMEAMLKIGATIAPTPAKLVSSSEVILLCLPDSETMTRAVEELPATGLKEKIVIDLGTSDLDHTRRMTKYLKMRNAYFVDAPISGTPRSVDKGRISFFIGGRREIFERCLPIFRAMAGLGIVTFCGPHCAGQVVKGVNDLATALSNAALLEAMAYGMAMGIEREVLWEALSQTLPENINIQKMMKVMEVKGGEAVGVGYRELPYFAKGAAQIKQDVPLTDALLKYLKDAPPTVIEGGVSVPSYWNQLRQKKRAE